MQWQFRKALDTFQGYKRSLTFKNEIENGDQGTLDVVLREIEIILADKSEKIITKVLGLRFVRDIMVLGQEDVVRRVEKLIPQLTKICSFQVGSADPDRGETYFHDHPTYLKLTDQQEKKQIDTLGSTFLILSLESVYHWAKWIPLDHSGQESIYARAYQNLVDRGVKFPTSFHYYKQSDTEKFKNMYKMEFFTDSYESAYSGVPSEMQHSQSADNRTSKLSIDPNNRSFQLDNKSKGVELPKQAQGVVEEYTGTTRSLKTIGELMAYLNTLRKEKGRKMGDVREINRKAQEMYEMDNQKHLLGKEQRKWIEGYLINFNLLNSNLLSYQQFLQRCVSEVVEIQNVQQEEISIDHKFSKFATSRTPNNKAEPSRYKVESEVELPEDLVRRQQQEYKIKINSLLMQLEERSNEIAIVKSNAQKERTKLVQDYQSRILLIKSQVKRGQQDRGAFQKELEKQNERLRAKIANLEEQLATYNYSTARQRDLQSQRNLLLTKVKKLEIQNDKLLQIKSAKNNFDKQLGALESALKDKEAMLERAKAELRKAEKQTQNYSDEATLYKSQLINERNKHDQKIQTFTKNIQALQSQNKQLKQKQLELRKSLDLKEIESLSIREELKRYQGKLKEIGQRKQQAVNNRSQHFLKSRAQMQSPASKTAANEAQIFSSQKKLKYNNYEDLYLQLKPINKQLFVRLCRCGLKKKDILLKENQVEVGIISELVSDHSLKFILHFTNTSERQVQNLKLDYNLPQSYLSTLDYTIDNKYVFCIQPQEQEKIVVVVNNKESPFLKERAILELSYDKNGVSFTTNLFLPFLIVKFFDFYRPKPFTLPERAKNARETIQLKFNRKMLPKVSSIRSYFQQAEQTSSNKYEVDGHHRETDLLVRIIFQFTAQTETLLLDIIALKEKLNDRQRYVFQQLVSFLQAAFKK